MVTFDIDDSKFTFRVVAVIIHNDQVLIHRNIKEDFWSLPGGRVEIQETSIQAIKREMMEELNVNVTVDRLLWITENFFVYEKIPYHEIGLFFLLSLPEDSAILYRHEPFQGMDGDNYLQFKWHPLDELSDIVLYPVFLKQTLRSLPQVPVHIIHHD